jgi:hypothetical protein
MYGTLNVGVLSAMRFLAPALDIAQLTSSTEAQTAFTQRAEVQGTVTVRSFLNGNSLWSYCSLDQCASYIMGIADATALAQIMGSSPWGSLAGTPLSVLGNQVPHTRSGSISMPPALLPRPLRMPSRAIQPRRHDDTQFISRREVRTPPQSADAVHSAKTAQRLPDRSFGMFRYV